MKKTLCTLNINREICYNFIIYRLLLFNPNPSTQNDDGKHQMCVCTIKKHSKTKQNNANKLHTTQNICLFSNFTCPRAQIKAKILSDDEEKGETNMVILIIIKYFFQIYTFSVWLGWWRGKVKSYSMLFSSYAWVCLYLSETIFSSYYDRVLQYMAYISC